MSLSKSILVAIASSLLIVLILYPAVRQLLATGGLFGKVELVTGNCMPTIFVPGQPQEPGPNPCKSEYVSRKIYIRKPITNEAWNGSSPWSFIKKKLTVVKTINSDKSGLYRISLPPGTYTVTVENESEEFCNEYSSDNIMCEVKVNDSWSEHNIKIFLASF